MENILCQVKSAVESASRPMGICFSSILLVESLAQKKIPSETKRAKKCIVSPEIEVSILHNANLDLEVFWIDNLFMLDSFEAKERRSKEIGGCCRWDEIIDSKLSKWKNSNA